MPLCMPHRIRRTYLRRYVVNAHGMNHAFILGLIGFYNEFEDFAIAAQDTLLVRSQKVANWLTGSIF